MKETTYRIMVIGEDHGEFCYANDIEEESVDNAVSAARDDYPYANVFVETESTK